MLTNPMLVMLKKFKLSLKRLKTKSLRKTQKHQFPLAFALIIQCFIVLLKLIIFKDNIWTKSGSVVRRCFFPDHLILNFFRLKVKVKVELLKLKLKFIFTPKYFQVLRQKIQNPSIWKTLKFGRKTILVQIGFTGLCVSVQNPNPSFGVVFFQSI